MSEQNEDRRRFLAIDDEVRVLVARHSDALVREIDFVVSRFYERIRRHPAMLDRFPGGEAQLARQEVALRDWLHLLLTRPPEEVDDVHVRVGRTHLGAGINEDLMISGFGWIRDDMLAVARRIEIPDEGERWRLAAALQRLLDYNLMLMLESYSARFRERAIQLDRLALIGRFAATVNHELRNPLGVIGTSSFLLRRSLEASGGNAKAIAHLDKIDRNLERSDSIISGLLRLLRIERPLREKVTLPRLFEEVAEVVPSEGRGLVEFRDAGEDEYGIFDPVQIGQVLLNLIANAREALEEESGRVVVAGRGDRVAIELEVRDDGPGIPDDRRERIFEPLFTTKSFGTGLGLTLARSIVDAHGGSLTLVDGLDERGVGFLVRIPHHLRPAATAGLNDS